MHNAPACPPDDYLDAIALARVILPPEVHLQAPPNLSDDFGVLLDAGIDDWGGVSPVTADHVNPERPWPDLDLLTSVTAERGFTVAPRLTAYPEFVCEPDRWFDTSLHFALVVTIPVPCSPRSSRPFPPPTAPRSVRSDLNRRPGIRALPSGPSIWYPARQPPTDRSGRSSMACWPGNVPVTTNC